MYYTCDQCHKLIKPEETWCMMIANKNHHLCRDCYDNLEKIKATFKFGEYTYVPDVISLHPNIGEDYPF